MASWVSIKTEKAACSGVFRLTSTFTNGHTLEASAEIFRRRFGDWMMFLTTTLPCDFPAEGSVLVGDSSAMAVPVLVFALDATGSAWKAF